MSVSLARAATLGDALEGRKLYVTFCFACHGKFGKGDGPFASRLPVHPRDHTDDQYMSKKTDEELFTAISRGGEAFHGSRFMPFWNKTFSETQIWDLVAYLRSLHRPHRMGGATKGKELYAKYCWVCHGESGHGDGPIAQSVGQFGPTPLDFTNAKLMATRGDLDLFFTIFGGGEGVGKSRYMPSWGDTLSEEEIWDLVAYLRSLAQQ
jgi:cbb3-type cytochrome c oxidase subunit III